jgi:hypothetical protein
MSTPVYLDGLSKVHITQDKVMGSVRTLEVTDGRTFCLGTAFLKYQTVRNAGLRE